MQLSSADDRLLTALETQLKSVSAQTIGVAVSGGGDSMALLHLLAQLRARLGFDLQAITVDHGLRVEAADEADFVKSECAKLDVFHAIARWSDWQGQGNLQDAARVARYRLIAEWAKRRGCDVVCIGHTQDDIAETFLMRLARESGVDGLSTMAPMFERNDVLFLRPMLGVSRSDLRAFLKSHDLGWCEDPSNENDMFNRVRARKALAGLAPLGITQQALAQVAENMSDAKEALQSALARLAKACVEEEEGDLIIAPEIFFSASFEVRRRLLLAAINWVVPADYPLRRAAVKALDHAIAEGRSFSLGGCLIRPNKRGIRIFREYNAVRDLVEYSPSWDRWSLTGDWQVGMQVKALGEPGLSHIENWRDAGLPRLSLMASPALWQKDQLIAAPLAGLHNGWRATLKTASFQDSIPTKSNYRIEPR